MNTFGSIFYDLLAKVFGGDTSSGRLQAWLDEVFANKYNTAQLDGFEFSREMQLDFTYEQWQRKAGIAPMATYVDVDSPAIPIGDVKATLVTGKIPRMKEVELLDEDTVRKWLIEEAALNAQGVQSDFMGKLFDIIDRLAMRFTNSMTYQRHQMVSTGALTLNDTNNPRGLKITLPAGVPEDNKKYVLGSARWWTDSEYSTEGADADPVKDIRDWLRKIHFSGYYGHIEVNKRYLDRILNHSAVISALAKASVALAAQGNSINVEYLTPSWKKATLEALLGVAVKEIDSIVTVKTYDRDTRGWADTNIEAFSPDVLAFVPDGKLGEILAVRPIYFQAADASFGTLYGGRLLTTIATDAVKRCQSFSAEMTSLCVPDKAPAMFYLYPNDTDKTA